MNMKCVIINSENLVKICQLFLGRDNLWTNSYFAFNHFHWIFTASLIRLIE
jgi:hypothetical protein